ncbi:MAG: signal peptidase II [Hyphomicrobiales bacterium]|nr:signal peptidase II [Hyphomicrobiales bacterium]
MRSILPYLLIVVVAVGVDQWIKRLVENGMALHEQVDLLPFLALYHAHNTGIAFSLLTDFGDVGLVLVALAVIAVVLALAWRTTGRQVLARAGFALVVGGAIGNLIDRATLGYVIDYILFHTPVWSFAIFNLADAFITVGAGLVLLQEFVDWRRDRDTREPEPPSGR